MSVLVAERILGTEADHGWIDPADSRMVARAYLEAEKALRANREALLRWCLSFPAEVDDGDREALALSRAFLAEHEPVAQPPERSET